MEKDQKVWGTCLVCIRKSGDRPKIREAQKFIKDFSIYIHIGNFILITPFFQSYYWYVVIMTSVQ